MVAVSLLVGGTQISSLGFGLLHNSLRNGFFEEFLFRGALLAILIQLVHMQWAIVLSSLLFGLWHLGANGGLRRKFPGRSRFWSDESGSHWSGARRGGLPHPQSAGLFHHPCSVEHGLRLGGAARGNDERLTTSEWWSTCTQVWPTTPPPFMPYAQSPYTWPYLRAMVGVRFILEEDSRLV